MKALRVFQHVLRTDYSSLLVIALVWQLILTFIGWHTTGGTLLSHMSKWDAGWYLTVLHDWYHTSAPSAAFYPLFPLLVYLLHAASFNILPFIVAGYIINTIALWLGLVALSKISWFFVSSRYRYIPIALLLSAPAAFFMHQFYTEAAFFCLSAWAYLFALRRKWIYVVITLACLTACRLPALLIVILCILEYLRSYDWSIRQALNRKVLLFLLTPAGFVTYGWYLLTVRGNFFAMFSAYHASNDWKYQVFNLDFPATIARAIYQPLRALLGLRGFDHDLVVNDVIPLLALTVLAATSLYAVLKLKKQFMPLGIVGLLSIIMFSINSNIVSAHRYTLTCLMPYVVGAYLFENHQKARPYIIAGACLSILLQGFLYLSLLQGKFAG